MATSIAGLEIRAYLLSLSQGDTQFVFIDLSQYIQAEQYIVIRGLVRESICVRVLRYNKIN